MVTFTCPTPPIAASFDGSGSAPWIAGSDLDMTLIHSGAGIKTSYDLLAAETGVPVDGDGIMESIRS